MSLQQTLKRLEAEKADLTAALASAQEENAKLTSQHNEIQDQLAVINATLDKLKVDHIAEIESRDQAIADLKLAQESTAKELEDQKALTASAEEKLKNPAFIHASAPGTDPIAVGGDAASTGGSKTPLMDKYQSLPPAEKTRFYRANEAAIKAETRAALAE